MILGMLAIWKLFSWENIGTRRYDIYYDYMATSDLFFPDGHNLYPNCKNISWVIPRYGHLQQSLKLTLFKIWKDLKETSKGLVLLDVCFLSVCVVFLWSILSLWLAFCQQIHGAWKNKLIFPFYAFVNSTICIYIQISFEKLYKLTYQTGISWFSRWNVNTTGKCKHSHFPKIREWEGHHVLCPSMNMVGAYSVYDVCFCPSARPSVLPSFCLSYHTHFAFSLVLKKLFKIFFYQILNADADWWHLFNCIIIFWPWHFVWPWPHFSRFGVFYSGSKQLLTIFFMKNLTRICI